MKNRIWENPEVIAVNKLPYRSTSWPTGRDSIDPEEYLYDLDDRRLSLNGTWRVRVFDEPDRIPDSVYAGPYHDWEEAEIPGNFELQGLGTPVYSNQKYPFKCDPPRVTSEPPEDWTFHRRRNPAYCCAREFTLPADWRGSRVRLYLGGVQSAVFVSLDGREVGYSQNSMSPAEFDLTPYLKEAPPESAHTLGLTVLTHCDGSYLEDQDFWRLSGIFRDVFLYALNPTHLEDIQVRAFLDRATIINRPGGRQTGSGNIGADITLMNESDSQRDCLVTMNLSDTTELAETIRLNPGETRTLRLTQPVEQRETWHPENPALHTLRIRLAGRDGAVMDTRFFRIGLTSTLIEEGVLIHNGAAVKLKGVNRHEHHQTRGRAVPRESMEEDARLMLRANINAVRCSHYPNHPYWYEICDRHGLFVMDEANMETHELSYHKRELPGDRPEWHDASLDRARSMALTNGNSPSVIIRSLGNEAGYGTAFEAMAGLIRKLHPGTLIHYADMNLPADFDSQTYPPPEWLEDYMAGTAQRKGEQGQVSHEAQHGPMPSGKPFILNEYAHAMGNSLGDAFQYWEKIYKHPRLAGGFIWEWCEHGLLKTAPDGRDYHAYGGDFGDVPNDGNFCMDGLIRANRRPNPSYDEAAHFHRFVDFGLLRDKKGGPGRLRVTNRFFYTDLSVFTLTWELRQNGEAREKGVFTLSLPPGETVGTALPASLPENPQGEWALYLNCPHREDGKRSYGKALLPLNYEEDSLYSPLDEPNPLFVKEKPAEVSLEEDPESLTLTAARTRVEISRRTGLVTVYEKEGRSLIAGPLAPCFYRIPTDNDRGWKMPGLCAFWKTLPSRLVPEISPLPGTGADVLLKDRESGVLCRLNYALGSRGDLEISMTLIVPPGLPPLPRIGLTAAVGQPEGEIEWYGRGPHENYCDRKTSALPGLYRLSPEELAHPYSRPQENGQRGGLRRLEWDRSGLRNRITADRRFAFSLRPYDDEALERAGHTCDLPGGEAARAAGRWTLHLDLAQMGVAGDNSWGAEVHEEYRLPAGEYRWVMRWEST